jgi:hypothetical protein
MSFLFVSDADDAFEAGFELAEERGFRWFGRAMV